MLIGVAFMQHHKMLCAERSEALNVDAAGVFFGPPQGAVVFMSQSRINLYICEQFH